MSSANYRRYTPLLSHNAVPRPSSDNAANRATTTAGCTTQAIDSTCNTSSLRWPRARRILNATPRTRGRILVRPRMKFMTALLCLSTLGCQPSGRSVEGSFTVNGAPKVGVEVRLPNDLTDFSSCGKAPLAAVTDQAGEFKAVAHDFPIRPCFKVDGKIYSNMFVVNDGTNDLITLKCGLPLGTTGHFEDGQICY